MLSKTLEATINKSVAIAKHYHHRQVTLEHLLLALTEDVEAKNALLALGVDLHNIVEKITRYLAEDTKLNVADEIKNITTSN